MIANLLLGSFCDHRTLDDGSLNRFGCVVDGSAVLGNNQFKRSKVKVTATPYVIKKGQGIDVDCFPLNYI